MSKHTVNHDPIGDIRATIADTLHLLGVAHDHKEITDAIIDRLPEFFRGPLQSAGTLEVEGGAK